MISITSTNEKVDNHVKSDVDCGPKIGERIQKVRMSIELTQRDFAQAVGISQSYIARIESGAKHHVSAPYLRSICHTFGIDYLWLATGAENREMRMTPNQELIGLIWNLEEEEASKIVDLIVKKAKAQRSESDELPLVSSVDH
jgi:transcriptional regulator with XRE-family HTH domain